jgi:methyl-accepting chemotaxis protein
MTGMNQAAKESSTGATQVNQSASELAKVASDLKHIVSQFRI